MKVTITIGGIPVEVTGTYYLPYSGTWEQPHEEAWFSIEKIETTENNITKLIGALFSMTSWEDIEQLCLAAYHGQPDPDARHDERKVEEFIRWQSGKTDY